MSEFLLQDNQTIVFAGDSITDCGRRHDHAPYGEGYVHRTIELITARYPSLSLRYTNAGIGGNTVTDLKNRWQDDVLRHQPDWVTIKIGINDLHRSLNGGEHAIPPEKFEEDYRDILVRTRNAGAQIVLIDPFYLSTDPYADSHRNRVLQFLPEYLDVVHRLSAEFDTYNVRTQDLFEEQLSFRPPDYFCPEPVHPYTSGHIVIAHGLLQAWEW